MTTDRLDYLIQQFTSKKATAAEKAELMQLMADPNQQARIEAIFQQLWDAPRPGRELFDETETQAMWEQVMLSVNQSKAPAKITRLWPRIAAAASILLVSSIGFYFYQHQTKAPATNTQIAKNDVAPGKTGATLTLANGQKILIADAKAGKLANQSGIQISKSANGDIIYKAVPTDNQDSNEFNVLATSRKEQAQIQLPDGSKVWLNAASSLKYPATFKTKAERKVELTGEAYFEVAKDKLHPFKVKTDKQEVEVLGTHFNINSYIDEPTVKTTLFEGSVKLTAEKSDVVIKPGEQAVFLTGNFKVSQADTEDVLAWKNGDFIFKDEPIESVMRKLTRWYDIDVIYQGEVPKDSFQGAISKFRNISSVLKLLEQTKVAHFKIEGRRVIVSRYTN